LTNPKSTLAILAFIFFIFQTGPLSAQDSDGDLIPDSSDIDDDNDGILDTIEIFGCQNAISYEFYDLAPSGDTVDNIPTTGALAIGETTSFDVDALQGEVDPGDRNDFSIRYIGYVLIATGGTYTFYTSSDDGSKLYINGIEVVDNDGAHGTRERSGTIALTAGYHAIEVLFFERGGGEFLSVSYAGPSITKTGLPFSIIYSDFGVDADGDGISNTLDLDSDGDGIPDNVEAQPTASYIAPLGVDSDGNGLDDAYESSPGAGEGLNPVNTDIMDCVPDFVDTDSDDDFLDDMTEARLTLTGTDSDGDGLDDAVDSTDTPILGNPDYSDPNGTINIPGNLPNLQNPNVAEVDFRDSTFDLDGDGVFNRDDLDDDNDGILDIYENFDCYGLINYEFYDLVPSPRSVDNIPTTGALSTGTVDSFDVDALQNAVDPGDSNTFSIRFTGFIELPTTGTYTFYTTSDDGSKLFINGNEVVDNDGDHPAEERNGSIALTAGTHTITVLYYDSSGQESLSVSYMGPSITKTLLPFSIVSASELCDVDGDGFDNQLDADSDGDGCNDADEAYGIASADTDDNGFYGSGTPTVNPDGTVQGAAYPIPADLDGNGTYDFIEAGGGFSFFVQPTDTSTCPSCNASFTLTSDADTFQWQIFDGSVWNDLTDGPNYSGTNTPILGIISAPQSFNGNRYRAIIPNAATICGITPSDEVILSIRVAQVITNRRVTFRVNGN